MADAPLTPFGDALAGALGASFASTVSYPLDLVKTRIQAGVLYKEDRKVTLKNKDGKPSRINLGLLEGCLAIAKREGLTGLYAGLLTSIGNCFAMQFAYFYWYSFIRNFYIARRLKAMGAPAGSKPPVIGTAMELVLGALAGAVAQLFTIPVGVIATRQQLASKSTNHNSPTGRVSSTDGKPPSGKTTISGRPAGAEEDETKSAAEAKAKALQQTAANAAAKLVQDDSFLGVASGILKDDGITGLWRGLKPSLVLTVNPAITYGVFERCKNLILASTSDGKMTPWRAFLVGALSKTLATVVTFPYILSKVRLQAKDTPYKGAFDVLGRIAKEEGISGWYQGMQAQIIKAVLTQAILFVARDYFTGVVKVLMAPKNGRGLTAAAAAVGGK